MQDDPALWLSSTRPEYRVETLIPPDLNNLGAAGRPAITALSTTTITMDTWVITAAWCM